MKLFSMYLNLCDHDTSTSQTDRRMHCRSNTALCVASCGEKYLSKSVDMVVVCSLQAVHWRWHTMVSAQYLTSAAVPSLSSSRSFTVSLSLTQAYSVDNVVFGRGAPYRPPTRLPLRPSLGLICFQIVFRRYKLVCCPLQPKAFNIFH